jgi:hypothetical protein
MAMWRKEKYLIKSDDIFQNENTLTPIQANYNDSMHISYCDFSKEEAKSSQLDQIPLKVKQK